jgi:WD40 repeat protein
MGMYDLFFVCITHNNHKIISGSRESINIWDATTYQLLRTLGGHTSIVSCVAISNDDMQIISGSSTGYIETGQLSTTLYGNRSHICAVTFSSDNRYFVTCNNVNVINIWDI